MVDLGTVEVVVSKTSRQTRQDGRAYVEYTFDISIDPELALGPVWRFTARYSSALETHQKLERVAGGSKGKFVLPAFPPKYRGMDMVNKEENVAKRGEELRDYYTQLFNIQEVMNHPMLSTNMSGLCGSELLHQAEKQTPENIAPNLMLTEENNRMIAARRNRLQKSIERFRGGMSELVPQKASPGDDGTEDEEAAVIKGGMLTMSETPYYFELGTRTLRFFADQPPPGTSAAGRRLAHPGAPSGEIPFVGAAVIQVDDETTAGRHCFDIETQETAGRGKMSRTFRLDAASQDDLTDWYVAVLEQQMLLAEGVAAARATDGAGGGGVGASFSSSSSSAGALERGRSDPPKQRGTRSGSTGTEDGGPGSEVGSLRASVASGMSASQYGSSRSTVSVVSEMPARLQSMKRLWEKENEYSLTAEHAMSGDHHIKTRSIQAHTSRTARDLFE